MMKETARGNGAEGLTLEKADAIISEHVEKERHITYIGRLVHGGELENAMKSAEHGLAPGEVKPEIAKQIGNLVYEGNISMAKKAAEEFGMTHEELIEFKPDIISQVGRLVDNGHMGDALNAIKAFELKPEEIGGFRREALAMVSEMVHSGELDAAAEGIKVFCLEARDVNPEIVEQIGKLVYEGYPKRAVDAAARFKITEQELRTELARQKRLREMKRRPGAYD